jgi:hypothetical protein
MLELRCLMVFEKWSLIRCPYPEVVNCLSHHCVSRSNTLEVCAWWLKKRSKLKTKDGFQEGVLHRSECKKWQTTAMFALKAHLTPMPSPDAFDAPLVLGPSTEGWAQSPRWGGKLCMEHPASCHLRHQALWWCSGLAPLSVLVHIQTPTANFGWEPHKVDGPAQGHWVSVVFPLAQETGS